MKGLLSSLPGTRLILKQCLYSELPGIFTPRGCFLYCREPPYKMVPNIQASTDGLFRSNSDDKFTFNQVPLGFCLFCPGPGLGHTELTGVVQHCGPA